MAAEGGIDMTINVDTIGQTIRKLRQERGMTLQELTDRSGVAMSSIVTIEAGRRKAGGTIDTLLRLLGALGMECVIRIADVEDIKVNVATNEGWRTRRAWWDPKVPGLAVVEGWGEYGSTYSVTHTESGKRLIPIAFRHRDTAIVCMRWLGDEARKHGLSWDISECALMGDDELDEIMKEAAKLLWEGET